MEGGDLHVNAQVGNVLQSDVGLVPHPASKENLSDCSQVGVTTLLGRLKQSINSAKVRTGSQS